MRIVAEIPHPVYKLTIFKSGHKHILKVDAGDLDQSFKFLDGEIDGVEGIRAILTDPFFEKVSAIFADMKAIKQSVTGSEEQFGYWEEII